MTPYKLSRAKGNDLGVLVVNDTRVDCHHGCYAVMGAIEALLEYNGFGPISYWPAHRDWRENEGFHSALASARLVLVNGEGTIHHNRPAGRLLLEVGRRARSAGVAVALINSGWEENGAELTSMLSNFDLVAARDSRSAELMRRGFPSVRVVPDLSLKFVRSQPGLLRTMQRSGVGFTDNVDRLNALSLERMRARNNGQSVSICYGDPGFVGWARFLRQGISLSQDMQHPVRLFALLRLRSRLWHQASTAIDVFVEQVAGLELLVSGRFHACTLALAARTPLVTQASNTAKISSLLADAGLEPWRANIQNATLTNRDVRNLGWSALERANLSAYLEAASHSADLLFSELKQLVSS